MVALSIPCEAGRRYHGTMSEADSLKRSHAWRSRFRARNHEAAHSEGASFAPIHCEHELVCGDKAHVVDTQALLEGLLVRLRAAGSFAFDSEFIGELAYVPKLCLIQIATTKEIALVDPLAAIELKPLWELLADASVEKIVHAGGQDVEPVERILGKPAAGVVDTQIAAGFARLPYPISLQRLVLSTVDVKLGKGLTFTDWQQRPLSPQQVRYAADDVRYLPAAWAELRKVVEAGGTMAWVQQECVAMCQTPLYQFNPETSFLKVRGAGTLDGKHLGVLRELATWRDTTARQADLPPRTVLTDEILVDLARRAPLSEEKLLNIHGLPRSVRVAHSGEILAAIARGLQQRVQIELQQRKSDELPAAQFRTDCMVAAAQTMCMSQGIDPQLAFTRSDIGDLLRALAGGADTAKCRVMQSWRGDVVGRPLTQFYHAQVPLQFAWREGKLQRPEDSGR